MKYKQWLQEVPEEFKNDALWSRKVYRYALFLADVAWKDVSKLSKNKLLISFRNQLFGSAGSASANISEGYSRRSKLDQALFYEYALGSARECRGWYDKLRNNLDENILDSRLKLLTEIIKMLLHIVPQNRSQKIKELKVNYLAGEIPKSELIENLEISF